METELKELRTFLKEELERRRAFNPAYSKAAFARDLCISLTALNEFLSGKRDLNFTNVDKVFGYLKSKSKPRCNWCETPQSDVRLLVGGPKRQFLCNTCIEKVHGFAFHGKGAVI